MKDEKLEVPSYSQKIDILTFRVKAFGSFTKKIVKTFVNVSFNDITVRIDFNFQLDYVYPDKLTGKIMKNRFLKTCSFFDDQDFKEYNSEPYNFDKKIDIIVTPINFYFKMKNTANYTTVHYYNTGKFKYLKF